MRHGIALATTLIVSGCQNPIACIAGNAYTFSFSGNQHGAATTALVRQGQPILIQATRYVDVGYGCDPISTGKTPPASVQVQRDGAASGKVRMGWSTGGFHFVEITDSIPAGAYRYTVTGFDAANKPLGTVDVPLRLQPPAVTAPTLSIDNASSPTATLTWTPASGHERYEVRFAYDHETAAAAEFPRGHYTVELGQDVTTTGLATVYEALTNTAKAMSDNDKATAADLKNLTVTVLAVTEGDDGHGRRIVWQHASNEVVLTPKF